MICKYIISLKLQVSSVYQIDFQGLVQIGILKFSIFRTETIHLKNSVFFFTIKSSVLTITSFAYKCKCVIPVKLLISIMYQIVFQVLVWRHSNRCAVNDIVHSVKISCSYGNLSSPRIVTGNRKIFHKINSGNG